eukprot:423631-Rhodomonas_salina.3
MSGDNSPRFPALDGGNNSTPVATAVTTGAQPVTSPVAEIPNPTASGLQPSVGDQNTAESDRTLEPATCSPDEAWEEEADVQKSTGVKQDTTSSPDGAGSKGVQQKVVCSLQQDIACVQQLQHDYDTGEGHVGRDEGTRSAPGSLERHRALVAQLPATQAAVRALCAEVARRDAGNVGGTRVNTRRGAEIRRGKSWVEGNRGQQTQVWQQ